MVLLSVPVALIEPCTVHVVLLVHGIIFIVHPVKDVVVLPILVMHLTEALFSEQIRSGIVLFLVTLILAQEVIVVFVVFHAVSHFLLEAITCIHSVFG